MARYSSDMVTARELGMTYTDFIGRLGRGPLGQRSTDDPDADLQWAAIRRRDFIEPDAPPS